MADQALKGVIAYGLAPHPGGTTTLYRHLAKGLRARGWRVFSVAVGQKAAQSFEPHLGDDYSVILAPQETALKAQVATFLHWLQEKQVDIVIPNCEENLIAAIPHLPERVRYLSVCHTVVRTAYLVSSLHPDRLSAIICANPRQMVVLERHWGVPREKLRLIPHGIDTQEYEGIGREEGATGPIRLIFLGRIEDMDKGVLWLPPILKRLSALGVPFSLRVVGWGADLEGLKTALAGGGLGRQVDFRGPVSPGEVPRVLSQADIFLMPSRFEGFGFSLLEAMAAGCVPIASHLHGITDLIVEEGISGFLCPVGRVSAFADKIVFLHGHRERLAQMAAAARRRVREAFNLSRLAEAYDELLTATLAAPPLPYLPRCLEEVRYPPELQPTWRTKVPQPLKNLARTWIYRLCRRIV